MCGIGGILALGRERSELEARLEPMRRALDHRGPDDRGLYIAPSGGAALAHTRLSIIDLSPGGHQPMASADERYWIVFNGEIYNFAALRAELEAEGRRFRSGSDTEVLLELYARDGAACVERLRGMFALAIWDEREQTCFLARDPLGIKPLYYAEAGSTLVFASELRAVLASGLVERRLSADGLYGYLRSGAVPEPHTMIEGVRCLEAGSSLTWSRGRTSRNTFWTIRFPTTVPGVESPAAVVRRALINSVSAHFVSDVPVGVFLSGGIDSSAIVAASRAVQSGALRTFSIAFEEPEFDESDIAREVAGVFGTDHTEWRVTPEEGRTAYGEYLDALDQPSVDGLNTYCVSKLAHGAGAKVVLSGLGGDEMFGGYASFRNVPKMVRWGSAVRATGVGSIAGAAAERWSGSPKVRRLGDFMQQGSTVEAAYRSYRGIFSHREALAITSSLLPDVDPKAIRLQRALVAASSPEDMVSELELSTYMRNQLLRDSDAMSMASALELRVPFVDRVFLETIAAIPAARRLEAGKRLLIEAMPEIPESVTSRPKRGFTFPFERWIGDGWAEMGRGDAAFGNVPMGPWFRRWMVAVLGAWRERVGA